MHAPADESMSRLGEPQWKPRDVTLLAALLLLQWLVQGAIVLCMGDVNFIGEEAEKAAASKAMLDGLPVQHHALVYADFDGGGFTLGHLVAFGFLVFGQSVLAVKAVALAYTSLILAAGFAFCRAGFGRRAAAFFGLLFVFLPGSFQKIALIFIGTHFQALLFLLLMLLLSARILFDGDRRRRTWLLLGLCVGFGVYFAFQNLISAAFVAAALVVRLRSGLLRARALWGVGGALAGVSPLLAMLALTAGGSMDVHGESVISGGLGLSVLERQRAFFDSVYGGRGGLDLLALVLVPLAPLSCVFALRGRTLYVVLYLAVFAAVYFLSRFAVGEVTYFFWFTRLSPFLAVYLLLTSAGTAAMTGHPRRAVRAAGWVVLSALVLSGARDTVAIAREGSPGTLARNWRLLTGTKGYQYVGYLRRILAHLEGDLPAKAAVLLHCDDPDPSFLRCGVASELCTGPEATPLAVWSWIDSLASAERRDFVLGLGPWLWEQPDASLASVLRAVEQAPEPLRPALNEAVGRFGSGWYASERSLRREIELGLVNGAPEPYLRGLGYRLYRVRAVTPAGPYHRQGPMRPYGLDPDATEAFLTRQDPRVRALLSAGYEQAERDHRLDV